MVQFFGAADPGTAGTGGEPVYALLDTGADNVFVHGPLALRHPIQIAGSGPSYIATQTETTEIHTGYMTIAGLPPLRTGYSVLTLNTAHLRYQIVLGRGFLRLFRFSFENDKFALLYGEGDA